jgi:hypothetical protein
VTRREYDSAEHERGCDEDGSGSSRHLNGPSRVQTDSPFSSRPMDT